MTVGSQYFSHGERIEPRTLLACTTLGAGALVLLFWAFYLTDLASLGQQDPLKAGFEAAFPLADLLFAAALIAAGILLLKRHDGAPLCLAAAAAISLYLGVLDVTFYAGHGLYAPLTAEAVTELAINSLCIGGGILGLMAAWRMRRVP